MKTVLFYYKYQRVIKGFWVASSLSASTTKLCHAIVVIEVGCTAFIRKKAQSVVLFRKKRNKTPIFLKSVTRALSTLYSSDDCLPCRPVIYYAL